MTRWQGERTKNVRTWAASRLGPLAYSLLPGTSDSWRPWGRSQGQPWQESADWPLVVHDAQGPGRPVCSASSSSPWGRPGRASGQRATLWEFASRRLSLLVSLVCFIRSVGASNCPWSQKIYQAGVVSSEVTARSRPTNLIQRERKEEVNRSLPLSTAQQEELRTTTPLRTSYTQSAP